VVPANIFKQVTIRIAGIGDKSYDQTSVSRSGADFSDSQIGEKPDPDPC